jgi:tRNA threonylcarbamoyladenosine biosynthesis protein TsaB
MFLLIDTSQETGVVAISKNGIVLISEENKIAKEHASWLHTAVARMLEELKMNIRDLEAVAVVAGPGSYTGLRVGMAAAKGFCYALKIPLITRNTLELMAESMKSLALEKSALSCPLIDARRDEVFTALYSITASTGQLPTANDPPSTVNRQPSTLLQLLPPQSMILDKNAFELQLSENNIIFFGSGAIKLEKIISSASAIFLPQPDIIQAFALLAQFDFQSGNRADPVYAEPVYLKEFFSY